MKLLVLLPAFTAGTLAWTKAVVPGVTTPETATALNGSWSPSQNVFPPTPPARGFTNFLFLRRA